MPRGPQFKPAPFDPTVGFEEGFKEGVGMMRVIQGAAQRKKQERDIEVLSALLRTDLKTLEALRVASQFQLGVSRAKATLKKQMEDLALADFTGKLMDEIPNASVEDYERIKQGPGFYAAYNKDKNLQKIVDEKDDRILFHTTGDAFIKKVLNAETSQQLLDISQEQGFDYILGKYDSLSRVYDRKFALLNPPVVTDIFFTNPDGTKGEFAGRQIVFSGGAEKLDTSKPEEGVLTTDKVEAERLAGPGGNVAIVGRNEVGDVVYRATTAKVPLEKPIITKDMLFDDLLEAGEKANELREQGLDVSIRPIPGTSQWSITSARTRQLSVEERLGLGVESGVDKENKRRVPGYDPLTKTVNGKGVVPEIGNKLVAGTTYKLPDGRNARSTGK